MHIDIGGQGYTTLHKDAMKATYWHSCIYSYTYIYAGVDMHTRTWKGDARGCNQSIPYHTIFIHVIHMYFDTHAYTIHIHTCIYIGVQGYTSSWKSDARGRNQGIQNHSRRPPQRTQRPSTRLIDHSLLQKSPAKRGLFCKKKAINAYWTTLPNAPAAPVQG